jgi:hydrogenase-1 operon protein HyaF
MHDRPDTMAGGIGPGSQPREDDGAELDYLPMPGAMRTYRQPQLPEPRDAAGCVAGIAALRALQLLLSGYRAGAPPQRFDLGHLAPADRRLVEDCLGEGEVSIRGRAGDASPALRETDREHTDCGDMDAQETRLAGVWRVRGRRNDAGARRRDVLEVADVPGFVRAHGFAGGRGHIDLPQPLPDGVMNAPGVVAELLEQVRARAHGEPRPPHIVNLTLLPQSEQDLALLGEVLGRGPVSILSRGYGNCRVTATVLRDVWWVQYFNSDDRLILNTLEVTDVPASVLAAQEDFEDSAERLREILAALTEAT